MPCWTAANKSQHAACTWNNYRLFMPVQNLLQKQCKNRTRSLTTANSCQLKVTMIPTTDECYRNEHAKVGCTEGPADHLTSNMSRLHGNGWAQTWVCVCMRESWVLGWGLCYSYEKPHYNQVIHIWKSTFLIHHFTLCNLQFLVNRMKLMLKSCSWPSWWTSDTQTTLS